MKTEKTIKQVKRRFIPRPFRLSTKLRKDIINYCLVMNYEFDDQTYDYPIIRSTINNKFCYISIIGKVLYIIFVDEENEYKPVFVNMTKLIPIMNGLIERSKLDVLEYANRKIILGNKLYHFFFSILYLENYEDNRTDN